MYYVILLLRPLKFNINFRGYFTQTEIGVTLQ